MTEQRQQHQCAAADWPIVAHSNHNQFGSYFGGEQKPESGKQVTAKESLSLKRDSKSMRLHGNPTL